MEMARIVFLSALESAPWGGSEELWSRTAIRLRKNGHSILACVRHWKPESVEVSKLTDAGIELTLREPGPFSLPRRLLHTLRRRLSPKSIIDPSCLGVCKALTSFRPALVLISQGGNVDGLHWMEWCREMGIGYVSVIQANAEHLWPDDVLADRLLAAHQYAKATYFVSQANLELFENQIGARLSNAKVVRNPYSVSYDATPPWPINDGTIRFACVGRLVPMAKGQDLILQVLALPQWRNRPIKVSLVGGGPMERSLRRLATQLGVQNKIDFFGHVTSIENVWAEHHALLLPSRYEGLPLALVEAMLCKRPAIVTAVAGNCEVLEDGVSGFVAPFPTVDSLANAMERAWSRRSTLQQMGLVAGREIRNLVSRDPEAAFGDLLLEHASIHGNFHTQSMVFNQNYDNHQKGAKQKNQV